jgi:fermentation-respiration switch protein FrsA (DUF1100 family)
MSRVARFFAKAALLAAITLAVLAFGSWEMAGPLIESANHRVAPPPADLGARTVSIASASGSTLAGWFVPGTPGAGVVLLLHGVRADRAAMLSRARFLHDAGYGVLLIDFQAHGESPGAAITFGWLESRDARAALDWLRTAAPGERIGAIGLSMGGAAATLAEPPLPLDALVLEEVYPTIEEALADRLRLQYGGGAGAMLPLFTWQMPLRIGITPAALHPIERVGALAMPKLFIAGAADLHTTLAESERLYAAAAEPKELWVVPGLGHQDADEHVPADYRPRVLAFLARTLRAQSATAR